MKAGADERPNNDVTTSEADESGARAIQPDAQGVEPELVRAPASNSVDTDSDEGADADAPPAPGPNVNPEETTNEQWATKLPGTTRTVAQWLLRGVGLLLLGVACVVTSLLLHLNTSLMRNAAGEIANAALQDVLFGKIQVGQFTELSADRVEISEAKLFDEQQQLVLSVDGLSVEFETLDDLWDLALGGEKISIVLPHARVERALVRLLPEPGSDDPTLVRALEPRPSDKPRSERETERHIRVFFQAIELGEAGAELRIAGLDALKPRLTRVRGSVLVSPKGVAVDVQRFGITETGLLREAIAGTGRFKLRSPGPMEVDFVGFAGDAEVQAHVELLKQALQLEVSVPNASSEALKALLPSWPFNAPASAYAHGTGTLEELTVDAEASLGDAQVQAVGTLELSPSIGGVFQTQLKSFDLRSIDASLPKTSIAAQAAVRIKSGNEGPTVTLAGKTEATEIERVPVPKIEFLSEVAAGTVSGQARILEPGATVETRFNLGEAMEFSANIPRFSLAGSRRLPNGLRGITSLTASATLKKGVLTGYAKGSISGFATGPVAIEQTKFEVRSWTDPATPEATRLQTELDVSGLQVDVGLSEPLAFQRAQVEANGSRSGAVVTARLRDPDGRRVQLSTRILPDLSLKDASFNIRQRRVVLDGEIEHLDPNERSVNLTKLQIRGAGKHFEGKLRLKPGLVEGRLEGEELRLGLVAAALGLPRRALRGTVSLLTELSIGSDLSRATVRADVKGASFEGWGDTDLQLRAELRDRDVTGALSGKDGLGFTFSGSGQTLLSGPALELASWKGITGTAELRLLGIPLSGGELLAPDLLARLDGEVGARFLLQRAEQGLPTVFTELAATGLEVAIKQDGKEVPLPLLSPYLSAVFDGTQRNVHGSAVVQDTHGQLMTVTASVPFDPQAWLESPEQAQASMMQAPLNVALNVPTRPVSQFPLVDLADSLTGKVGLQMTLHQSLSEPRLSVQLNASELTTPGSYRSVPLSAQVRADYAPKTGDLKATAVASSLGRTVVRGAASGTLPTEALTGDAPWDLDSDIRLSQFPLSAIAPLADRGVTGAVTGSLDLNTDEKKLGATLDVRDLTSGRAVLGKGTLFIKGEPGHIGGRFRLSEQGRTLGLDFHTYGESKQIPLPHQLRSLSLTVSSRRLSAAAFSPFLEGVLARVDGDVNTALELSLLRQPALPGKLPVWTSSLEGTASLENGNAYVDALGLELRDISTMITAAPTGRRTAITFSNIKAKARSEEVNLEGQGQFLLEDSRIDSGNAQFLLRSVPITLEGLRLGEATGSASAVFQRHSDWNVPGPHQGKDFLLFEVDLNYFRMKAARTVARNLISLGPNPDIVVVQEQQPEVDASDILPLRLVVRLNQDVAASLAELNIPMTGETTIDYTDSSRVSGTINLTPGGRMPMLGTVFEISSGQLILNPDDPGNPGLNVNLVGESDAGDLVYLNVAGTVEDAVLDPPASELQSLLGGAGNLLSGGVQALGVNDLLNDFELFGGRVKNLELRVSSDSEQTQNPSYSAAVQYGEKVWIEGTLKDDSFNTLGAESETEFSYAIDYRFHPDWSLKFEHIPEGGGGSVDLQWQYRY